MLANILIRSLGAKTSDRVRPQEVFGSTDSVVCEMQ